MDSLYIESTEKTPLVHLDPTSNIFRISGKSIPSDAEAFYAPIIEWFDIYATAPENKTTINIDLEYFNISSSKRLLFIMYKLNELSLNGHNVELNWYYNEDDEEMYEVGQDYAFMVKVPFQFIVKKDELLAAV